MSKKIVFFGLKYSLLTSVVKQLIPFLTINGYNVIFVHGNSVSSKLKTIEIDGLVQIDLFKVNFKNFYEYLKLENNELFILLGYKSMFDILSLQIAKSLGIKCLYLEHGLFIKGIGDSYNFRLFESVPRYIHFINVYIRFLSFNTRHSLFLLRNCINAIMFSKYQNVKPDTALFYTSKGADLLYHFRFNPTELYFSGYPLADNLATMDKLYEFSQISDYVVFLHQPVIRDGLVKISYEDERKILLKLSNSFKAIGLSFILKLHPRETLVLYEDLYKDTDIKISTSGLFELVKRAKYIISQFSTAIFYAVLLKIPIVIIKYPTLKENYIDLFRKLAIVNPSDKEIHKIDAEYELYLEKVKGRYRTFIEDYIGFNNTFEHQAKVICQILRN